MRVIRAISLLALTAALLAGCGSSGGDSSSSGATTAPKPAAGSAPLGASARDCEAQTADASQLHVTGVNCARGRALMLAWQRQPHCAPAPGSSRSGCTIGSYRCLAVLTAKGISASCAEPGRSVAFLARHG
jgi:hypothetical protein